MAGLVVLAAAPAGAENPMKACGAKYQAARAARTVPAGQTWPQFLSLCRASLPKPADAPAIGDAAPSAARQPTAGQFAARARMKECAAQYHADKDAGKLASGQTWPGYYSACNARAK